jgi:serine phosphatase RsbU (regulator of sigma subunit)
VNTPHVQVILDQNTVPAPLRTALNRVKARVSLRSLDKALASGISPSADVCVILPHRKSPADVLDRILADASSRACATMIVPPAERFNGDGQASNDPIRRLAGEGDDASAMNADELTGRIRALCEIRSPLQQMRAQLAELRRREAEQQRGPRHLDEQLRLAAEVQRELLPGALPRMGGLSVEALYLPADFVSGDIYDVSRLDEDHLGLSLADATGHGLPAALLTIFIKNSFRGKEITGDDYRILRPDEILDRLNAEIVNTRLSQCQFITALHAVYDSRTATLRWARGGVPYPVLARPGQTPRRLVSAGTLVGAFEKPVFEVAEHAFEPGDTLLMFTDGLEALLQRHDPAFTAGDLAHSIWLRLLADQGLAEAMEEIRRLAARTDDAWQRDDITLLAASMEERTPVA